MRPRLSALVCLAVVLATPATAVPPPPPPANFIASWKAIEALAAFEGTWIGDEVQHTPSQNFTRPAFRVVKRLGGKDVILLEQGVSGALSGNPDPTAIDIINFDVKADQYQIYLPGYRLFTDDEGTSQLVTAEHPDPQTLTWSTRLEDGSRRRTTVVVNGRNWLEHIEQISPEGVVRVLSDLNLTQSPVALAK